MTEKSMFWEGTATGDSSYAPYDAADEFAGVLASLTNTGWGNKGGVFRGEGNNLAVTGIASPVSVASGSAIVAGTWYNNSAAVSVACAVPVGIREDLLVLRKDWADHTVRIALVLGADGGAAATLTQSDGVHWEIPLAQLYNNAGVITVTDVREFVGGNQYMTKISEQVLAAPAHSVTFDNIPQSFKHLKIIGLTRLTEDAPAAAALDLEIRVNDDATANAYMFTAVRIINGANPTVITADETSFGGPEIATDSTAAADQLIPFEVTFYDYTSAMEKFIRGNSIWMIGTEVGYREGYWQDTDPITKIVFGDWLGGAFNYVAGSIFTLYGLP